MASHNYTPPPGVQPMRVFLVQTAKGLMSSSGGYKANICLLRHLASRGHVVRQLCYSYRGEVEEYVQKIAKRGGCRWQLRRRRLHLSEENGASGTDISIEELTMNDGIQVVSLESEAFEAAFGGKEHMHNALATETADYIEIGKLSMRLSGFVSFLQDEVQRFSPTHIICNDGLSMQATSAMAMPNIRVCRIGIIHTAEQLPFGPFAGGVPGQVSCLSEHNLLQKLDGVWSVSNAIKQYALAHGQLRTTFFVHHPWTYLEETTHTLPARLHNWDKRYIGMINPCPVKGAKILIDLARLCPQHDFLVYKSWGFDDDIGKQLENLQNVTVRSACKDMEEAWRDIKVLLVPSLWFEAWGIVLVEAHLRGIPVISSDAGALPEAMLGLNYIVPVNPIKGNRNDKGTYIVPDQDIEPWVDIVNKLMSNKSEYEEISMKVRDTTSHWLKNMDELALENWLHRSAVKSGMRERADSATMIASV